MTLLTLLSCGAVLLLLAVVAVNLVRIGNELWAIGGAPTSSLARIRWGLRAIETETSHLAPQVTKLNLGLKAVDGGLRGVESELAGALSNLNGGAS